MFFDVMLHDDIVAMRVNPDVHTIGENKLHDVGKHMMHIWIAGYAMNDMIWTFVIEPLTIVDFAVSWFGRFKKCEICNHTIVIYYDIATTFIHVCHDNLLRRIAVVPLMKIARRAHRLSGCLHHVHDGGYIVWYGMSDDSVHNISRKAQRLLAMAMS